MAISSAESDGSVNGMTMRTVEKPDTPDFDPERWEQAYEGSRLSLSGFGFRLLL